MSAKKYCFIKNFDINAFFNAIANQNKTELTSYFNTNAVVFWPNTQEIFCVEDYIKANCEYPGNWQGEIEQVNLYNEANTKQTIVLVYKVWNAENIVARSVSFICLQSNGKIQTLTEFWGDVTQPPIWRRNMNLANKQK